MFPGDRRAGNVPFLSMGQLVKPGQAVAWRGPMAGNALSQLVDAHWGDVRDIIVDLPPGTGDIQLVDDPEAQAYRRGDHFDAAGSCA